MASPHMAGRFEYRFPPFTGQLHDRQDPFEFIEDVELEAKLTIPKKLGLEMPKYMRMLLRRHLTGPAQSWYRTLDSATRSSWPALCDAFVLRFPLELPTNTSLRGVSPFYDLQQRNRPIHEYVYVADTLIMKMPEEMVAMFTKHFVMGLSDHILRSHMESSLETNSYTYADMRREVLDIGSRIKQVTPRREMSPSPTLPDKVETEEGFGEPSPAPTHIEKPPPRVRKPNTLAGRRGPPERTVSDARGSTHYKWSEIEPKPVPPADLNDEYKRSTSLAESRTPLKQHLPVDQGSNYCRKRRSSFMSEPQYGRETPGSRYMDYEGEEPNGYGEVHTAHRRGSYSRARRGGRGSRRGSGNATSRGRGTYPVVQ